LQMLYINRISICYAIKGFFRSGRRCRCL
jgi:hypothetical protein